MTTFLLIYSDLFFFFRITLKTRFLAQTVVIGDLEYTHQHSEIVHDALSSVKETLQYFIL